MNLNSFSMSWLRNETNAPGPVSAPALDDLSPEGESLIAEWTGAEVRTHVLTPEMAGLSPEVRREPRMALTPGGDGLDACRAIAAGLPRHLAPGGRVLLEIGPTQGAAVSALLAGAGLERVRVRADMDGRDRVVEGRRPA